jgi:phospholipid transport system substrate-binding protein
VFKNVIILLLLSVVSLYAIKEQNIKTELDSKVTKVLSVLKNKSLSQKQREQKSIRIIDSVFDYHTMAKISLGKRWKTLTKTQKAQFTKRFEKKLKHSYLDKLRLYNNQRVVVKNTKKVKHNRIIFETQIYGQDGVYKVSYLLYKKKQNNEWYIYDVNLVGVSIIQTYRKQFSEFLKTKSFNQLLKSL